MKRLICSMMLGLMVTLAGCNSSDGVAKIDDVEYVAVDNEGELVLTPVTIEEIEAKKVNILTKEEYDEIKKGGKKEEETNVVKAALLNKQ